MSAMLDAIYRYPVKGLSGESLNAVTVEPGCALAGDRRFAISQGSGGFDSAAPRWLPKRHFVALVSHEALAQLRTRFDVSSGILTILRDGREVARGDITSLTGRELINQFLAAFLGRSARGTPRIVEAPGLVFTDIEEPLLSIINLGSIRDLQRVARGAVDPVRFRANLWISGPRAWSELDWVGQELTIGEVRLEVVAAIERCAATTVNPTTAERDLNIPKLLMSGYRHRHFGIYARVKTAGAVRRNVAIEAPPNRAGTQLSGVG